MITKEERDRDAAICKAATPGPLVATKYGNITEADEGRIKERDPSVGEPLAAVAGNLSLRAAGALAESLANAHNRLPLYIADAAEMERRIAEVERQAVQAEAMAREPDRDGVRGAVTQQHAASLRHALRILQGGQ